jgi:ATP-binding cassette subfamily C protein
MKSGVEFLRFLFRDYRWRLIAVFGTCVLGSLLEGVGVILLLPLLSLVGIGTLDPSANWLKSLFVSLQIPLTLEVILGTIFLIFCFHGIVYWFNAYLMNSTEHDIISKTRQKIFRNIFGADWSTFLKKDMGVFSNILIKETERVGSAFTFVALIISATSLITIYMVSAFKINWRIASIVMGTGILLVVLFRSKARQNRESGSKITSLSDQFIGFLQESLIAAKFIKASGLEEQSQSIFRKNVVQLRDIWIQSNMNSVLIRALGEPISVGLLCVCIYVGVKFWGVDGPSLLVLLFIFMRTSPRITDLQKMCNMFLLQVPAFERIEQFLNESKSFEVRAAETVVPVSQFESLEFRDVTFGYNSHKAVVKNVDLKIIRGQMIGIAGASGSGKSTLIDLMVGLLKPNSGHIHLNGVDLCSVSLSDFRKMISYVTQETLLFHDTLLNNILWIKPSATREEVELAVKQAQCQQFVESSSLGLETVIGDRGTKISGGQKQRLALARAFLRTPQLLVLDEATSALDSQTESEIMSSIESLKGKVTIVVIAHRLSTLKSCDKIYYFQDGRCVETGDWDTLSKGPTQFANSVRHLQETRTQ